MECKGWLGVTCKGGYTLCHVIQICGKCSCICLLRSCDGIEMSMCWLNRLWGVSNAHTNRLLVCYPIWSADLVLWSLLQKFVMMIPRSLFIPCLCWVRWRLRRSRVRRFIENTHGFLKWATSIMAMYCTCQTCRTERLPHRSDWGSTATEHAEYLARGLVYIILFQGISTSAFKICSLQLRSQR